MASSNPHRDPVQRTEQSTVSVPNRPGSEDPVVDHIRGLPDKPDQLIAVPFEGWTADQIEREVKKFVKDSGLDDEKDYIHRGAILAQDKKAFSRNRRDGLKYREDTKEEHWLGIESSSRRLDMFSQTWQLYALVIVCSLGATVQGWDEAAVSGAQIFYEYALDIATINSTITTSTFKPPYTSDNIEQIRVLKYNTHLNETLLGLVNSAPYLCCAFSCWLNYPLNRWLGRRGTILLTCLISSATCLGQGFVRNWQQLFVARLLLGFGIGPKSATIPIFAAECAPANIRGALVMMWQMWTAAGIMLGYIAGVILRNIAGGDSPQCQPIVINPSNHTLLEANTHEMLIGGHCSMNWRLMLASPMILPLVVVAYVYTLPESPRWLIGKAHRTKKKEDYDKAFQSLVKLRHTKLQAARDLFLIHHLLLNEAKITNKKKPFKDLLAVPRNRRALTASAILMFFQQFCGVNIMVYYSSYVFYNDAKFSTYRSLIAGMGFGIINFVFALPAVWTIDSFGRRNLLLCTFPLMAIFQMLIAIALALDGEGRTIMLLVGMYLFSVAYSPGEGPVPFVYSAESMPLYNRDIGMAIATAITWFFNFFLAITFPQFQKGFGISWTFGWYAIWCFVGWWAILLLVPETKNLNLEQLDEVFRQSTKTHVRHGLKELSYFFHRYVLFKKSAQKPELLQNRKESRYEWGEPGPGEPFEGDYELQDSETA